MSCFRYSITYLFVCLLFTLLALYAKTSVGARVVYRPL